MKYVEYHDSIRGALRRHAGGLTWEQLPAKLRLPYERPCPEWTEQLEAEIGLTRVRGEGAGRKRFWKVGRKSHVMKS